ncbi:cytoskeletal protein binding protein [Puccinia graminis f. sp. tritici]|uniref:Actin cytoskeleton-regulatory complex protein SLA1 n=1 Tax=Puccinia graminis f. sp. tritici TaxID=56615 RepID=A0A5B0P3D5_PUCGR|nr:cytoskeletal protein binding protein [Puccinia graminis f. sp. tritici]KAA1121466.1 cytoskeletal protein binding protein [Puccinia graminis f. sp. tritici]
MASPAHLALLKAEYAYTPQTEDEIALEEEMLYYLLDDSDPDWFKVKLKASPASADPPQSGLVPANYVVPAQPLRLVTALYAYEAQTEDELIIQEDESLQLYEEDGDWSLVGRHLEESGRGVGYVPTAYIEAVENNEDIDQSEGPASEIIQTPASHSGISNPESNGAAGMNTWSVTDIDHKKKKRKGTLVIDSSSLIFASESDKSGIQKYDMSSVSITKTEKGKHLMLQCGSEERHFQVSEKDLDEIVLKIQRFQQQPSASPPKPKSNTGLPTLLSPAVRPPSAMANPDKPSGVNGRKVSFAAPLGKPATALYDFEAQGDDELTVEEGDRLYVLDDTSDDDWWKCAMQSDGKEGVVPASYIELDQGQPSGNQEAAEAAMTAAAAVTAKNWRIQEEEDARLAQQLANEDSSEAQLENARAADRKLIIAREAEQRKNAEAELAARRKKESESRRREAERAMTNPGFSNGPSPPKLTARPDSAQGMSYQDGNGSSPAPPRRPDSAPREGRSKPQGLVRTWRDRTGQFKVEAEFRGLQNGKIRLHKLNGVTIEVPLAKMSSEDVIWLEGATGRTLRNQDADDIPLATLALSPNRPVARSAPSEPPKRPSGPAKPPIDWFEFFLNAGCDLDDCTRYSTNFERDRIDENLLPDLEPGTMRNLGLREGDVLRVRKYIKQKYGSSDGNDAVTAQIQKDEELARKLQQQDVAPAPNIFTNGPNGSLKNTRRGRPTPNRSGSSAVDIDSITNAKDKLVDAPQAGTSSTSADSSLISITPSSTASGFDDDAWQVRPNSTTPAAPAPVANPPARSASINATPATSSADLKPTSEPSKPSLNDEIFEKIMNHAKQSEAAASQSAPVSAPMPPVVPQPTGFNPNGPRGPLAPVASNAPLLNPLVPLNSGMSGFVPTRPNTLQAQPTGFNPTNSQMNSSSGFTPNPMAMQPTGMGLGMGNQGGIQMIQSQPTGMMQPPAFGMMQSQPTGMMQSQPTGMMQSQPTGMMQSHMTGMAPQPTGMNQMGNMQPQMTGFNPAFSSGLTPPVPSIPSMYAGSSQPPAKSFNPSDIFGQMKTGQFAQNAHAGPQDPNKYNALRAQPTGFGSTGGTFTQQFMPNNVQMQQQQQQSQAGMMQPLTAQPTGFAPGGYLINQQTGIPPQNQFPNQNPNQQWRGF